MLTLLALTGVFYILCLQLLLPHLGPLVPHGNHGVLSVVEHQQAGDPRTGQEGRPGSTLSRKLWIERPLARVQANGREMLPNYAGKPIVFTL